MSAARAVLLRLLRRAESAFRRGDVRPVRLTMSQASCPEYAGLDSLSMLERFHAEVALAERDGAIVVERDRVRGDGSRLLALALRDAGALARHLGVNLHDEQVNAAAETLAAWRQDYPVINEVLAAWRQQRKVRGAGPEAAAALADAARVAAASGVDEERIVRRESVRLFGDSKRLETLWPWLDVLRNGELAPSGLGRDEALAAWGLRREPQPLLLAGTGKVHVDGHWLPLVRPWLGLPMQAVDGLETDARWLISIENLASFHDAARTLGDRPGLLVYTGGMPSPAWRAAYARLMTGLAADASIHHWGDIDEGGFRIAATIAAEVGAAGRSLTPWCMAPDALSEAERAQARPADASTQRRMQDWARRAGWPDVAEAIVLAPLLLEQEAIPARFPAN